MKVFESNRKLKEVDPDFLHCVGCQYSCQVFGVLAVWDQTNYLTE